MITPLEKFVLGLSTQLLGVSPGELAKTIADALARLCTVLDVDRGYVLKVERAPLPSGAGTPEVEVFEQWWAPGVEQRDTPITALPLAAQKFWMGRVRSGEVVHADDVDELEARCPEAAAALRADGVRSILFIPLLAGDAAVGFIGFDTRTRSREWTEGTVGRLRAVGELLVTAIERCRADLARQATAETLARRNAELERSNRDLQQFASIVSHDLKQPLIVARGFVDLLGELALDHPTRGEEAVELVEAARRSTTRMSSMIDDILALALSGIPAGTAEPVDLGGVVEEVLADLGAQIEATAAEVSVGQLPTVEGSATQLRRLFQNLLSNALKYHRPDRAPTVAVSASDHGQHCIVAVADDGIGIPPARRRAVLEMFARAAGDTSSGLGIGLGVSARVVENHGGQIWIDDNEHGGTTVRVQLPYRQPAAPAPT